MRTLSLGLSEVVLGEDGESFRVQIDGPEVIGSVGFIFNPDRLIVFVTDAESGEIEDSVGVEYQEAASTLIQLGKWFEDRGRLPDEVVVRITPGMLSDAVSDVAAEAAAEATKAGVKEQFAFLCQHRGLEYAERVVREVCQEQIRDLQEGL